MHDDALKTYDETLWYSKKAVKLAKNVKRRPNNTENSRTDSNLDKRIDKFHDFIDLCLVNFPIPFNAWYTFTLERDLNRSFE